MWKLPRLASLNLAGNKLRSIGEEIEMEALADLNLEDNLLHRLPAAIGNLTALKVSWPADNPRMLCLLVHHESVLCCLQ